jgi:hypothetical protein
LEALPQERFDTLNIALDPVDIIEAVLKRAILICPDLGNRILGHFHRFIFLRNPERKSRGFGEFGAGKLISLFSTRRNSGNELPGTELTQGRRDAN